MLQASWQPWLKCSRRLSKVNLEKTTVYRVSPYVQICFTVDCFSQCDFGADVCFVWAGYPTAVPTTGCPPGFSITPSTLTEPLDIRPEERSHRGKTSADPEQKVTTTARTKPLSHQDNSASRKEEASADAGTNLQAAGYTQLPPHKPSQQMAPPSQVDFVCVSTRSKSREPYLQGGERVKADSRLNSERQSRELPVRDEKRTDWSMTSSDSDTGFQVPRLSYSGRKVEPVRPFSVSTESATDFREFGSFTPDESDLTVYNEIAKKTPHTQTSNHPKAKMSTHRQPTPGSEGGTQHGVGSRPVFSELRQCQQDSGFDSPFYHKK